MAKLNKEDLVQVNIGRSIKYKTGDRIDRLIILNYEGKRYVPSVRTHDPVYSCVCDCGNELLRRQQYLVHNSAIRQCEECGRKTRNEGISKYRISRGAKKQEPKEYVVVRPEPTLADIHWKPTNLEGMI